MNKRPTFSSIDGSVTHDGRLHPLHEGAGELFGNVLVHDESVGGGARLAHVPHLRRVGALHGGGDVRVLKDDERCVAAQLHGGAQNVLRGLREQGAAHGGGSGERDLPQALISHQRGDNLTGTGGGHHVQHAVRQARLTHQGREVQGAERSQGGGLEHRGAARRERRGDLACRHGEREVPGGNQQAGADGAAYGGDLQPGFGGEAGAAKVAGGFFGVPAQVVCRVGDFAAGLVEGLAHFEGHEPGDDFGALRHERVGAVEDVGAFADAGCRP